jgi:hypothetical protein
MTTLCLGNTKSGLPNSLIVLRQPVILFTLKKWISLSSVVLLRVDLTFRIISLRCSLEKMSAIFLGNANP